MLQKSLSVLVATMFLLGGLQAQNTTPTAKGEVGTMNTENAGAYYHKYHSRMPFTKEAKESMRKSIPLKENPQTKSQTKALQMPNDFWFPGEFEEVQAIVITWVYETRNLAGTPVGAINETLGGELNSYGQYTGVISSYISKIDTTNASRYPAIFADVATAIQKGNAQVWINVYNAADSNIIKQYMSNRRTPLTNYRFFVSQGNSFWYRDCGPVGFYYGDKDSVAFLDFEYYSGRAMDDQLPIKLGAAANIPVFTTSFEYEGGNIILDGARKLFTSDMLYDANEKDAIGQMYISNSRLYQQQKSPLTKAQIQDTLKALFGLWGLNILPTLQYDGGTGHIDLYAAMWDMNNFVFTQYPTQMSSYVDYKIAAKNIDSILTLKTVFNKKFKGSTIPLPKKDDDTWYTSDSDFKRYTRTYSNSTFVNNVIIQPIFSNDTWGASSWDSASLVEIKKDFPGYEIIPVDIRGFQGDLGAGFDGSGGAIHCITKQIPAENPVRILHGSQQDEVNSYKGQVHFTALLSNKRSGIASATCYWRKKGTTNFTALALTGTGKTWEGFPGNEYNATISRDMIGTDTIEYYISATSNNGKTMTKPYTAPKGLYHFYLGVDLNQDPPLGTETIYPAEQVATIGNFYPNPASDVAQLQISNAMQSPMNVTVFNNIGQVVYSNVFTPADNEVLFQLKTSSFKIGVYNVVFSNKAGNVTTKKLVISR